MPGKDQFKVYYLEILKKAWSTDKCYSMGKLQIHFIQWKKHTYCMIPFIQNVQKKRQVIRDKTTFIVA